MNLIFLIVFGAFAGLHAAEKTEEPLEFSLKDLQGKAHTLSEYRGKAVIVDFWAIWCVSCRRAFPILNELNEKYGKDRLAVLGVSYDQKAAADVEKFAKKAGLHYTVLLDPSSNTAEPFKVESLPTLLIFSADGKLVERKIGISEDEKEALIKAVEAVLP